MDGGVFGLLGLIAAHRGAVEYDWRTRFGLALTDIGGRMSLWEAARLAVILRCDPSSMIAAALEGWDHPISREALVLMDTYDVHTAVNTDPKKGRPKPHTGRPFSVDTRDRQKFGDTGGRSRAEVVAILNAHGHNIPV